MAFWHNTYGVSINQKACGGGIEILGKYRKDVYGWGPEKADCGDLGNERE